MQHVTAQILDGKATAAAIKHELTERVAKLKERGFVPGLGTVLVGDDPASHTVLLRGKGSKERLVPVGAYALDAVSAYLTRARPELATSRTPAGAMFLNARGGRLSRRGA